MPLQRTLAGLFTHNALPYRYTYCAFDSLREEESLVNSVDGVIRLNITLSLQQNWSGVQSVISPEDCEPSLFVSMDQGPEGQQQQL